MTSLLMQFDRGRRARVWLDGLPLCQVGHHRAELHVDLPTAAAKGVERWVAVELAIPRGARQLYGLLGGAYRPGDGDRLRVVVPVTDAMDTVFSGALSQPIEEAYCGLLGDYGAAITSTLSADTRDLALKPGTLRFEAAAHTLAGSAPIVFRHLAWLVVTLGVAPTQELDEENLQALTAAALHRIAPD